MGSASSRVGETSSAAATRTRTRTRTMLFGLRGLRRWSVALAAVSVAAAAVGAVTEALVLRERCGMREKAAVGAVAAVAVARIAAMVGMARAQEVTAVAVASDADRAEAPTQDFAKRETGVGRHCLISLSTLSQVSEC
ncbi:hypothetical protein EJB05_38995, partial [Eragrostis curvula]